LLLLLLLLILEEEKRYNELSLNRFNFQKDYKN